MKRIADMMNFPGSACVGLEGLIVEKIDMYRETMMIRMVISNLHTLENPNGIVEFIKSLSEKTSCKVSIYFTGNSINFLPAYYESLQEYIKYCFKDISYANECVFKAYVNDGIPSVNVECGSVCYELMDESGRNNLKVAISNFNETILGMKNINISFSIYDLSVE